MNRRSIFVSLAIFLLGLGALCILGAVLLRHEYGWYQKAQLPPGIERQKYSQEFVTEMLRAREDITSEREWIARFSDVQINSYLEEAFKQSGIAEHMLPEGISDPRVIFNTDRIRLAFRYGTGLFSSVISIDLRIWLVQKEQNVMALELEGFHAGALPISAKSLLEKVSEVGRQSGIAVAWYRDHASGHPVAVLRFEDDKPHPTMVLQAVQVEAGHLTIRGKSPDAAPPLVGFKTETH